MPNTGLVSRSTPNSSARQVNPNAASPASRTSQRNRQVLAAADPVQGQGVRDHGQETTSFASSFPVSCVSISKVPLVSAVKTTLPGEPGPTSNSLSYPCTCTSSATSLVTVTLTVRPTSALTVWMPPETLPPAIVTVTFT